MHVLLTGGCGFIGSNLVRHLEKNGPDDLRITVFDNLSTGRRDDLDGTRAILVTGDITDRVALGNALAGVDRVVHLAAHTRVVESVADPRKNMIDNVVGTFNLLEAARGADVESVVVASTGGAIMGDVEPPVHEEMVPKPVSPYGASKLCCEAYCSAFAGAYGLAATALRFANVYGPYSYRKGSAIAKFFRQIRDGEPLTVFGDGTQTRDFVYVEDLCEGIRAALTADGEGYEYYHLGSGYETSVNDLISMIRNVTGVSFEVRYEPARPGEIYRNYTSIDKARSRLGFSPKTPLETGLERTWKWFTEQSE